MQTIKVEQDLNYKPDAIVIRCGEVAYSKLRKDGGVERKLTDTINEHTKIDRNWRVCIKKMTDSGNLYNYWVKMDGYLIKFTRYRHNATVFFSYKEAFDVVSELVTIQGITDIRIEEGISKDDKEAVLVYGD